MCDHNGVPTISVMETNPERIEGFKRSMYEAYWDSMMVHGQHDVALTYDEWLHLF